MRYGINLRPSTLPHHPSLSLSQPSNPSKETHFFPTCDMTDQSGSSRFQAILESAVQAYEKKTGVILADLIDSFAVRLQRCLSVDDIATLLQGQAKDIDDFQQRDRVFKSIKTTVSILSPISSVASVADNVGLVRRKVQMTCFTSLTIFIDIAPTCNGDTRYSRYPTNGICCPWIHIGVVLISN